MITWLCIASITGMAGYPRTAWLLIGLAAGGLLRLKR